MDTTRKITTEGQPPKKKRNGFLVFLKYFVLAMLVLGIAGTAIGILYVRSIVSELEDIDPNKVSQQLYENSVILDSNGKVLEYIQSEGLRKVVSFNDINPSAIDAFIAVEDKTFMTHQGFNVIRMFGATLNYILGKSELGGVSTISQQLARNVYLFDRRQERSLKRKIEEAYYTIQLEKYLTKEQIIEAYLNLIFFGMESYGIEAASNTYFGKSAKDLDYIESALLVGTVKAPSYYAPMLRYAKKDVPEGAYIIDDSDQFYTIVFNENCQSRYETCLYLMHENGKITDKQLEEGLAFDIRTKLKFVQLRGQEISSFFSDIVKEDVINDLMQKYRYTRKEAIEVLHSGGLKIYSTIDFDTQRILESHFEKDNFNYYFGNALVEAITIFQRENGLEENGKADTPTLDRFCELTDIDRSLFPDEFYAYGEEAEELQTLKQGLNKLGYFVVNEYFPKITPTFNEYGDIINRDTGRVTLQRYDNVIDEEGRLVIYDGEYEFTSAGTLTLFKNYTLKFYPHYDEEGNLERIQVAVADSFKLPNGYNNDDYISTTAVVDSIYIYTGRDVLIPDEYKKFDEEGNIVISRQFLRDNPDFFVLNPEDNSLRISEDNYVISHSPVVQPQAAMVIVDNSTGQLKALVGGRNVEGYMLYNRATNPRQPGSAIKPISVYTAAMDSGRYSPASVIDDRPVYLSGSSTVRWPINWYETYGRGILYDGLITIREAIRQSSNVPAAILANELGVNTVIKYLKNFGITSIVEEGAVNDYNIAAVSLGAMSRGISPLEMAQAYACIANDGQLNKVTSYTKVTNNRGETLLEKHPNPEQVLDSKVAYLVKDMLRTSVSEGLARNAMMTNHTAYGKTGTTSDNFDVWFTGFTTYYTGATWFGNDINIPLSMGSEFTAGFWRKVMDDVHKDLEPQQFAVPDGIISVTVDRISGKIPTELTAKDPRNTLITDIFIRGFEPTEKDDVHVEVKICKSSGKLATEFCPEDDIETKVMVKRPVPYDPKEHKNILLRDSEYDAPTEKCDVHNKGSFTEYLKTENMQYRGKDPLEELSGGDLKILRPYPIEMLDGTTKILKAGAIVMKNGDIVISGDETIPAADVYRFEKYTAEQLDAYFGLPPAETDQDEGDSEDDNSDGENTTESTTEESTSESGSESATEPTSETTSETSENQD